MLFSVSPWLSLGIPALLCILTIVLPLALWLWWTEQPEFMEQRESTENWGWDVPKEDKDRR